MQPQNGTGSQHRVVEERLDAFKDGVTKLIDRIVGNPRGESSRLKLFTSQATETIKAHPIAAAGIALGLGYLVIRVVRR